MADCRLFSSTEVRMLDIPDVHAQVDMNDLSLSGCLLSPSQITQLIAIQDLLVLDRRYTQHELAHMISETGQLGHEDWPYSIYKLEGEIYIVYKGLQANKELGVGRHGKVKLAQRLSDLKFFALKLQLNLTTDAHKEFRVLRRVGATPHRQSIPVRLHTPREEKNRRAGCDRMPIIDLSQLGEQQVSKSLLSERASSPVLDDRSNLITNSDADVIKIEQYSILMNMAPGKSINDIIESELLCADIYKEQECSDGNRATDNKSQPGVDHVRVVRSSMPMLLRLQLALSALEKLNHLHVHHHVLHRDLQPGNIMLDETYQQEAFLIDYGQALVMDTPLSRSGSQKRLLGSGRNLSPELRRRISEARRSAELTEEERPVFTFDWCSDIYGIGITLAYLFHVIDEPPHYLDIVDWIGSYINGADHAETESTYAYRSEVLSPEILEGVIEILREMTVEEPQQRCHFNTAIEQFQLLIEKQKCIESSIKVGLVDIALVKANGGLSRLAQIALVDSIQEIWLIDSSEKHLNTKSILAVKRSLEEMGIRVGNKYFHHASQAELQLEVEKYLSKRPIMSEVRLLTKRLNLKAILESPNLECPSPKLS